MDVRKVEEILHHHFENLNLLELALTHSSVNLALGQHNERLEFLGDAILGMVVCHYLYHAFPDLREGDLTRIKSTVVSRRTLSRVARDLGLQNLIHLGKGISLAKPLPGSILANVFEALVAALYLDGGIEKASAFLHRTLGPEVEQVLKGRHRKNYKSSLQHLAQLEFGNTPTYRVIREEGPSHLRTFEVVVKVGEKEYGRGYGSSKKEAEQDAARATLEQLELEGYSALALD